MAAGEILPVEVLIDVGAGQQREPRRAAHVVVAGELAGLEDHLEVRAPARLLDRRDLVVHLAVAAGEERAAVDHHVDLGAPASTASAVSASFTSREDRPDGNAVATAATPTAAAPQRLDGDAREVGVDADRRDRRHVGVLGIGTAGLRAQRGDLARGVGALERRQVDHRDRQVDAPGACWPP